MKIPKKFEHKGKTWKVIFKKNLKEGGEQVQGLCVFKDRIIYLDSGLSAKEKVETFLHELFHVVICEAHINQNVRFSEGVEEVLCDAFADLMITSFKLNWKKLK